MSETNKDKLHKSIQNLRQILELPKLYLADYFIDLRNKVDKAIVFKLFSFQNEEEKKNRLNETWQLIIQKINLFEKKSVQNPKIQNAKSIHERLNSIETILANERDHNLEGIEEEIQLTEFSIRKQLFRNKTIAFVDVSSVCDEANRQLIDYKLAIVNDHFIRNEFLERK